MANISFEINGNIPPKKNSRINLRNGVSIPSKRYKEWHLSSVKQIKSQLHDKTHLIPLNNLKYLYVVLYYDSLRRKDNSNTVESIHDLLVDCGVLVDDCWQVTGVTIQKPIYRKNNAGALITLRY